MANMPGWKTVYVLRKHLISIRRFKNEMDEA